jgi:superfamily II DNA or RNA helicase
MEFYSLSEEQKLALKHIQVSFSKKINPICALGMGMGKTRVAYETIKSIVGLLGKKGYIILIVIKVSNFSDPWERELTKNLDFNNIIFLHGIDRHKYKIKDKYHFPDSSIILTPYETLRLDIENGCYKTEDYFDLIIYDELHTIVNSKRLTKRIIAIGKLKAHYKLALTGTPLENYIEEIGLINIFLNDADKFIELTKLAEQAENDEDKTKEDIIKEIYDKGRNDLIENDVIFHYSKLKEGIERSTRIFSVPIDERMYKEAESNYTNFSPKQRRFLSHPASVLKNIDKKLLPQCIKAEAIKFILRSTLSDEKVIIFSLFIDVLNVYSRYCEELGYNSVIITGKDKGKNLNEKLKEFKFSDSIKILFTTLQKSSEGLNLDVATHVIILEFWWNPQKLFQAMSRIDRLTQERNIFLYLLCYNYKGALINIENEYFSKLSKKVDITNAFYAVIDEKRISINDNSQSQNYELPEIITFEETESFEDDFSNYLSIFQHTQRNLNKIYDDFGASIVEVREKIIQDTAQYINYTNNLSRFPWQIELPFNKEYIINYFSQKLYGQNRYTLLPNEDDYTSFDYLKPAYEKHYPIIYERTSSYNTIINRRQGHIEVRYILGKQNTGKYDILVISLDQKRSIQTLLHDLKANGISDVSLILYSNRPELIKSIKIDTKQIFPKMEITLCMTKLFHIVCDSSKTTEDQINFDKILRQETIESAHSLCLNIAGSDNKNAYVYKRLNTLLSYNQALYRFKPNIRSSIGTTNIIQYIGFITQLLLNDISFDDIREFHKFVAIVCQKILAEGKSFIPTWDTLNKSVDI